MEWLEVVESCRFVACVRVSSGVHRFPLYPLFSGQKVDYRVSGLPDYQKGAVRASGGAAT